MDNLNEIPSGTNQVAPQPPSGANQVAPQPVANPQMMNAAMLPWFMASPWVPRFSGEEGAAKFVQWRAQVEACVRAQGLNTQQRADFVLNALDGRAHRVAMLLADPQRESDTSILEALARKYGDHRAMDSLRAEFFECRQAAEEGVEDFILRLRESFSRWKRSDPDIARLEGATLRSQFSRGLTEGAVKEELQRLLRRSEPPMTFEAACNEAMALERECGRRTALACRTRAVSPPRPSGPATRSPTSSFHTEMQQWKETFRAELKQEIQAQVQTQVALLGKSIVDELRETFAPYREHTATYHANQQPPRPRPPASREPFQWDEQGRPICIQCREVGHTQRSCPRRNQPPQDFPARRPQ